VSPAHYYQSEGISADERERLIIEHLPQVRLIARKIHERLPESVTLDDLLSAGVVGLEQKLGRAAEESEIASELGMTVEDYRDKLNDVAALDIGELEFLRDERESPILLKYVATPEEDSPAMQLEKTELEKLIAWAIERIPQAERTVLSLYFYEELTLREIADIMGIHFSRVSQIKSQAVLRLRNAIGQRWPGSRGAAA